jgi:hypothetical protein
MCGKWHLASEIEVPNGAWPTRRGFDRFFGQLAREGQSAGEIREDVDLEALVPVIIAAMDGLQIQWLIDMAASFTSFVELLRRQLAAAGEPSVWKLTEYSLLMLGCQGKPWRTCRNSLSARLVVYFSPQPSASAAAWMESAWSSALSCRRRRLFSNQPTRRLAWSRSSLHLASPRAWRPRSPRGRTAPCTRSACEPSGPRVRHAGNDWSGRRMAVRQPRRRHAVDGGMDNTYRIVQR